MITNIRAKNFKAFESLDIDLAPITVFLGPNNSGKSAIISIIRLLAQTASCVDPNVSLLLNGEFGDFGTYKDIVYKNKTRRHIELGITVNDGSANKHSDKGTFNEISSDVKYRYRSSLKDVVLKETHLQRNHKSLIETAYSDESDRQIITKLNGQTIPYGLRSSLSKRLRMANFFPARRGIAFITSDRGKDKLFGDNPERLIVRNSRMASVLQNALENVQYLGGMRAAPERTFPFSGERRRNVGRSGEHAANLLVLDHYRKGSKTKGIMDRVVNWLSNAGIASNLEIRTLSDRHYELYIQHPNSNEYENFADVGYGNSQILPVLVGGYNLNQYSSFLVEQPEIHLHPRAQAELGDFFLDLHINKVQSIIETHSEHLVLRIQQHVATGKLNHNDVIFYYVYPNDGAKFIKQLHLNRRGTFTEQWPEGFFPERLIESKKLAQARYSQEQ